MASALGGLICATLTVKEVISSQTQLFLSRCLVTVFLTRGHMLYALGILLCVSRLCGGLLFCSAKIVVWALFF